MVVDASTARGSHTSLKPRGATNLRGWRCAAVIGGRCARGRHWCPVRRRVAQRPRHLLWPAAVTEKKPKPCEATAVNAAATVVAGFIASFLGCRLAAAAAGCSMFQYCCAWSKKAVSCCFSYFGYYYVLLWYFYAAFYPVSMMMYRGFFYVLLFFLKSMRSPSV